MGRGSAAGDGLNGPPPSDRLAALVRVHRRVPGHPRDRRARGAADHEVVVSVGERVLVLRTSAYVGQRGLVTRVDTAGVWVLLDGQRLPMSFATYEVVRAEEQAMPAGGAE